jgi:glycosyltransferase involved in cell wall biosynthesis
MPGTLKKPRILFLDQTGQLGGAELYLADVAEFYSSQCSVTLFQDGPFRSLLEKRGVSVSILSLDRASAMVSKGAGLRSLLMGGPRTLTLACRVAKQARDFDLIYANTAKALIVGSVASLLASRPLLYHLHDIISADHFSPLNRRLLVTFGNRARAVVANSEATRRAFIASGGRPERTHVAYNGFDPAIYSEANAAESNRLRAEFGIGDAPCVLMVGRLTPWKGQHLLLEAIGTLLGVHAVIAGGALFTDEDRAYADQLHHRASAPDLSGRVHFAGFRDDLPSWYQMAELVVNASSSPEPFGRVIVEGMLAGKPVIATRGGGASEIITDGETGYLVESNNVEELSRVIQSILANTEKSGSIADRGREHARRKFSKEAVLEGLDEIVATEFPGVAV